MLHKQYRIGSGGRKPILPSIDHGKVAGISTKKSGGSGMMDRIDQLQRDLFSQLDKAGIEDGEYRGDPLDMDDDGERPAKLNKYERLAAIGKNHVQSNAGEDYEVKKAKYNEQQRAKQRRLQSNPSKGSQKSGKGGKKVVEEKYDEKVFMTGAGLAMEDQEDDDEDVDEEEKKDQVGDLYQVEDEEANALMNELLAEIKEDCLRMQRVLSYLTRETKTI